MARFRQQVFSHFPLYISHCYILLAGLFDAIIGGTTACGELLLGRKLNFKLSGIFIMIIIMIMMMMIIMIIMMMVMINDDDDCNEKALVKSQTWF